MPSDTGRNAQLTRTLRILMDCERSLGITLEELAQRYGTTPRTIRRDMDALKDLGYTFTAEDRGRCKVWRLNVHREVRRLSELLDKSHYLAVRVALDQGGPLRGTSVFSALEDLAGKIEKSLGPKARQTLAAIERCFYPYEKHAYSQAAPEVLWPLIEAIEQRRLCRVVYRAPRKKVVDKEYELLPLSIFVYQGAAYLMAHIPKHDKQFTLNLQRLKRLRVLGETASVPQSFDPAVLENAAFGVHTGGPHTTYVIRFSADVAPYIRERIWHPSQKLSELSGGRLELRFSCGESWEVSAWVASWRGGAEALAPASLRAELCQIGQKLTAAHGAKLALADGKRRQPPAAAAKRGHARSAS